MMKENIYTEINFETLQNNLNEILINAIPVWRKNKSGKLVIIPVNMLEQYIGNSNLSESVFYIEEKWKDRIKIEDKNILQRRESKKDPGIANIPNEDSYLVKRKSFINMSTVERENNYEEIIDLLKNIDTTSSELSSERVTSLIEIIAEGYAISKTSFDEISQEGVNDTNHVQKVAKYTTELVENVLRIIENKKNTNIFMHELHEKSSGSTVDHMNNVFLIYSSFLYYYNSIFKVGRIARIRSEFKSKYKKYYNINFPEINAETLENVFKGGMSEIPEENLLDLSLGAFLHDIGKIDNINYFEGEEEYNRKIIMKHAPMSYNIIIKTREFTSDVALLSALHHEYYGNSAGYGLTKIIFPEKNKKFSAPRYCMSYNIGDLKSGLAIAYVPAKILEVVDVFSALIDKKRKYRPKEFTVEHALEIMQKDFIEDQFKLDPILFNIFVEFVTNHSIIDF